MELEKSFIENRQIEEKGYKVPEFSKEKAIIEVNSYGEADKKLIQPTELSDNIEKCHMKNEPLIDSGETSPLFVNNDPTRLNELSFTGSKASEQLANAEYYEKEARNAYGWYESYLKDGNDSKAKSYLETYEKYKERAESAREAAKWAAKE